MTGRTPGEDDASIVAPLREGRPRGEHVIARRLGINRVLDKVLGRGRDSMSVGTYVLERKVGEGGMGVVYLGRDPATGARAAIKLLERGDDKARTRFAHEAEVLRGLRHDRIVRYLDHGTTAEGYDYLVMEWLDGTDLAQRLDAGPLTVEDAVRIGYETATGLAAAHAAGVLHRDVKPSNLFLAHGDVSDLRVIDFGIAHAEHAGPRLTSTGAVIGTPHYMAPEQIRGAESVRTDVYSLGATLYECLTGRPPFAGEHPAAVLLSVIAEPAPSARAARLDVSLDLDALLGRMMAKDPRDRPIDMGAVVTELSALLGSSVGRSSAPAFSLAERLHIPVPTVSATVTNSAKVLRGRARELAHLHGEFAACEEDGLGAVTTITGDAGCGKSALCSAFTRELRTARPDVLVVDVGCGRDLAGASFAALRAIVRHPRASSVPETHEALAAVRSLLDRVCSGAIRYQLTELMDLGDQLRSAWFELVSAWYARGPIVFVVDDAQWLDLSSLRFLRRALDVPTGCGRLLVLAGSDGTALREGLRTLNTRRVHSIVLAPLGERSATRLAGDLAPGLDDDAVIRIVAGAACNPARIEALCCASTLGALAEGATQLELARARLEVVGAESRRIVRAASLVVGPVDRRLVARLVGADAGSVQFCAQLEHLVRAGLLRVVTVLDAADDSRVEVDGELLRIAALEASTEADLQRGHLEIARWLGDDHAASPAQIIPHLRACGALDEAARYYLLSAQAALAGEDLALVEALVSQGETCTDDSVLIGLLESVRSEAAFWSGDLQRVQSIAHHARARLRPGSVPYYAVTGLLVTAAGQVGANDTVRTLVAEVAADTPEPDAGDARLACMCRGVTQLSASSDPVVQGWVTAIEDELGTRVPDPATHAWVARMRAWQLLGGGLDDVLESWMVAYGAHVRAGDVRAAAQIQINLGSLYVWTGDWERAEAVLHEATRVAERLDSTQLRRSLAYTKCKLASESRPFVEARDALLATVAELDESPRMQAGAFVYLGLAALRLRHTDAARDAAQRAAAIHTSPVISLGSRAVALLADVSSEVGGEWLELTRSLDHDLAAAGALPEFQVMVELAVIEGYGRAGKADARDARLRHAYQRLLERGLTLREPLARARFSSRPYAHSRIVELVAEHLPSELEAR